MTMTDPKAAEALARLDQKFRKTATIRARQWWKMGDHPAVVLKSAPNRYADEGVPWCPTLEGGHVVTPGDWIATGVQGEHWPIKADIFAATYEPAAAAGWTPPTPNAGGEAGRPVEDDLLIQLLRRGEGDAEVQNDAANWIARLKGQPEVALAAQPTAQAEGGADMRWIDGEPPKPWRKEWFIAKTTYGDRVVLRALPEEYHYDYTTADHTYIKADKIKCWMQFPDSEFIEPEALAGKADTGALSDTGDAELRLRLEWATGMLRIIRKAPAETVGALAQGGIDLATADEEAIRDAGNEEALEALASARTTSTPPIAAGADVGLSGEELDRLEALAKAATQKPWETFTGDKLVCVHTPRKMDDVVHWSGFDAANTTWAKRFANAEHIAAFDPPTALRLIAAARASTASPPQVEDLNVVGAAERDVGRWVYSRIEALIGADPGTPEGDELSRLAAIAENIEEYGYEACAGHALPTAEAKPGAGDAS